jgi:hypothetical protein
MQAITTIGLDIAKSVFQIHGIDAAGNVTVRRKLKRPYVLLFFQKLPPCVVGIEACASSHHWSRELQALGHTVRLMPPAYVKPYIKRQKNDAADAEAICEAVTRPNMRFVACLCGTQTPSRERRKFVRRDAKPLGRRSGYIARAEPSAHGGQTLGQPVPVKAASRRSRARVARALTGAGWSGTGLPSPDGGTSFRSAHQDVELDPSTHCDVFLSEKENSDSCKVRPNQ